MVREGYKETEFGEIPEEWGVVELNCISNIEMGQSPPSSTYNNNMTGLPFFQGCGNFGSKNPIINQYCSKPLKMSNRGDILISVRAPVGELNLSNIKCCIGRGLASISNKPNSESIFLYYSLLHLKRNLNRLAVGSTFEAINSAVLNKFILPFPSLPEQHCIATVLSTLDECIEKTEALIAKLKLVKAGLMQDLLTRGIDSEGRIRDESTHEFKDTEIGRVPVEWDVVTPVHLSESKDPYSISIGPFGSNLKVSDYSNTGVPIIFVRNIRTGIFFDDNTRYVPEEKAHELRPHWAFPGDILITKMGEPPGEACYFNHNISYAVITADCIRFKIKNGHNSKLFVYILNSQSIQKQISQITMGVAQSKVSLSRFKSIFLPVPTLQEQNRITLILSSADYRIEQEESYRDKLLFTKKGLMADLLTGWVRMLEEVII